MSLNPFYTAGRVPGSKFIGRKAEIRAILGLIWRGQSVEVVGPSRIGKSSLLARIGDPALELLGKGVRWLYFDFQAIHSSDEFWSTVAAVLRKPGSDGQLELREEASRGQVVLCLDEIEKIQQHDGFPKDLWGHLRALSQHGSISLILAVRKPVAQIEPLAPTSPLSNVLSRVDLGPFSEEESRSLISQYLEPSGVAFSETEIDSLLHQCEGHPAVLQELCAALYDQRAPSEAQGGALLDLEIKPESAEAFQVSAAFASDRPSDRDLLWDGTYARALEDFLTHPETKPPLVIGIDAPWGGGKSSLMRTLQKRIDPDFEKPSSGTGLTLAGLWKALKGGRQVNSRIGGKTEDKKAWTVWFDAWKYSRDEQLWAALVRSVIRQVTDRMQPLEREDFLLRLHLSRIDREQVRRRIWEIYFTRAFPWLLLMIVTSFALLVELTWIRQASSWWWNLNLIPAFFLGRAWLGVRNEPIAADVKLSGFVKEPAYAEKVGFLGEVEEDFRRIRSALGTRPLVIFVDDLDRCSPGKISELVEAINIFFGIEECKCFFVLGLDARYAQAGIKAAYEPLVKVLDDANFGVQFLDKIVQVWLRLPPLNDADRRCLMLKVLDPLSEPNQSSLRSRAYGSATKEGKLEVEATMMPDGSSPRNASNQEKERQDEEVRNFTEKDPEVQEILVKGVQALGANPRQVKLFLNRFRLEALLSIRLGEKPGRRIFENLADKVVDELRRRDESARV